MPHKITCTKRFNDIPFAHRQHNHEGHCRFIHGHNWSFEFEFVADHLDDNGFVVDFGDLDWLKDRIDIYFDHTLVLNQDDPALTYLCEHLTQAIFPDSTGLDIVTGRTLARTTVVDNCGAEGIALWLMKHIDPVLQTRYGSRNVHLARVTVFEDSKNFATVYPT